MVLEEITKQFNTEKRSSLAALTPEQGEAEDR